MNKTQEFRLRYAVASLSRAEQNNNLHALEKEYKKVRKVIDGIYKKESGVLTVLLVEQIMNNGNANVLGNSPRAYERMHELAEKAASGLKQYGIMKKNPENYVAISDATREGIGICAGEPRVFHDNVPFDPVRAALVQFRKEMTEELSRIKIDAFPDSKQTNLLRFTATIKAERSYLEEFLAHRKTEYEETKQQHIADFDKRMERLILQIDPTQEENSHDTAS
jgi:hypothetical protein